jgi:hypothetical protein
MAAERTMVAGIPFANPGGAVAERDFAFGGFGEWNSRRSDP